MLNGVQAQNPTFRQRIAANVAYYRGIAAGYRQWVWNRVAAIGEFLAAFIPNFRELFTQLFNNVGQFVRWCGRAISNVLEAGLNVIKDIANGIARVARFFWENMGAALRWVGRKIRTAVGAAIGVVYGACAVGTELVGELFANIIGVTGLNLAENAAYQTLISGISLTLTAGALFVLAQYPFAALALVTGAAIYKERYPDAPEPEAAVVAAPVQAPEPVVDNNIDNGYELNYPQPVFAPLHAANSIHQPQQPHADHQAAFLNPLVMRH